MKLYIRKIWMFLRMPLAIPTILFYCLNEKRKAVIKKDITRWKQIYHCTHTNDIYLVLHFLLNGDKCLRNIIYKRIGCLSYLFKFLLPENKTLHINMNTKKIGSGLFVQHGDCCYIAALEIGENCWVNQGVTIGYSNDTDAPIIGNNVSIYAGAKVIGNNVKIGANAVVVKDIPDNCTVVGAPAIVIRKNIEK